MKCLVVGDSIKDKYVYGSVERISPEAPIAVLDYKKENLALGGALNVAANIKSMIPEVELDYYGFYDSDVCFNLDINRINFFGIKLDEDNVLTKTRFIGNDQQQLLRLDKGLKYNFNLAKNQFKWYFPKDKDLNKYDLIVVSDYNKGTVVEDIYNELRQYEKSGGKLLIEAKRFPLRFEKNTILKCNYKEYIKMIEEHYTNWDTCLEIIITRGDKGFKLENECKGFSPNQISDVIDVVGAGDSFLAGCASSFLKTGNFNPLEMAQCGNIAAGEAIKHRGTYVVSKEELEKYGY